MNDQTLERIRQQELQIQASLLAARRQAESAIHDAELQCETIRQESARQLATDLARLREEIQAETEREVAAARATYAQQAAQLASGAKLVPRLSARLCEAVTRSANASMGPPSVAAPARP